MSLIFNFPKKRLSHRGFSLIEVLVATGIFALFVVSIALIQSRSLDASAYSEELNIVALLAGSKMAELEAEIMAGEFNEFTETEEGSWPEPYSRYRWTRTLKTIEIPPFLLQMDAGEDSGQSQSEMEGLILRIFGRYITQAVRELTLVVRWEGAIGSEEVKFSTLLVNTNEEIQLPF